MNPVPSQKRLNEARGLLAKSNFSQALPAYQKLVQQFPRKAQIWFEFGCAAGGAGQIDLATRLGARRSNWSHAMASSCCK